VSLGKSKAAIAAGPDNDLVLEFPFQLRALAGPDHRAPVGTASIPLQMICQPIGGQATDGQFLTAV
jgi:hypothetical protein